MWGGWFGYGCYLRFGKAGDKCSGHDIKHPKSAAMQDITRQIDFDRKTGKLSMPAGYLQKTGELM